MSAQGWPEPADRIVLAEGFAEAVARSDLHHAECWAAAFFHAAGGGFALFDRRGETDHQGRPLCRALKRDGELCRQAAAAGEPVCANHRERRRQRVPDDGERRDG